MSTNNITVFRDICYNYIEIDKEIVRGIINTAVFQRLRRVEQSNLNILHPSATHNRFQHSIGTYYLAKELITSISKNNNLDEKLSLYFNTFKINKHKL